MAWTTQAVFSKGELTPKLRSRYDLEMYRGGLEVCLNFKVLRHGGLRKRSGTRFVGEIKNSAAPARLIPFVYNTEQAYALEMGDSYLRAIADGGIVQDGGGPSEAPTPFSYQQAVEMHFTQSADIAFTAHEAVEPQQIKRLTPTTFEVIPYVLVGAPPAWVAGNYPKRICFYQERLTYAGTPQQPQTFWLSKSGVLNDFTIGEQTDDALEFTVLAGQVNSINFIDEGERIAIGTTGAMRSLGPATSVDPFSPTNVSTVRESTNGASAIQAIQVGTSVLFVGLFRKTIREYRFSFDDNSYVSPDISIQSDHITAKGISQWAYAEDPDSNIYMQMDNGELAALTYDRDQGVVGYVRHHIAGGKDDPDQCAFVESVCVIPEDNQDRLYMIVRRTINGQTKRYIEYLEADFEDQEQEDAFFVDCGLTYEGPAASVISGLDHLEGEMVDICSQGAALEPQQVVGGQITLPDGRTTTKCHVGLHYNAEARTLPAPINTSMGSSLGAHKKPRKARVSVLRTNYLKVGTGGNLENLFQRSPSVPMGSPIPLQTGTRDRKIDASWADEARVTMVSDLPLPATITGVTPLYESEP